VADYFNLVSNGLVMAASTTDESPEVAQALVNGTLRGIQATLDDPDAAFDIVLGVVPEAGSDPDTKALQRAVLAESLRFWQPPSGQTVGAIDIGAWNRSREFLAAESTPPLTVPPTTELVDTRFVENYSAGR
jgi:NitT/TauT family transport system substrate-binding protein